MGLDMVLETIEMTDEEVKAMTIEGNRLDGRLYWEKSCEGNTEGIAIWHKANAIHNWFVNNVQGGDDDMNAYIVQPDDLKRLVDTCNRVLDDPTLAETLLPTESGFFFGTTDYDDYYFETLSMTACELKGIEVSKNEYIIYLADW